MTAQTPIQTHLSLNATPTFVYIQILINFSYRIYSIKRPGRLLNFWTLRVGAYLRWALNRGWALIKFLDLESGRLFKVGV